MVWMYKNSKKITDFLKIFSIFIQFLNILLTLPKNSKKIDLRDQKGVKRDEKGVRLRLGCQQASEPAPIKLPVRGGIGG